MNNKNRTMIKQYFVEADPETGEWLTTPQFVKEVDKAQWDALADTHATHYDTYEHHFVTAACVTGERMTARETRAIEVRWENRVDEPCPDCGNEVQILSDTYSDCPDCGHPEVLPCSECPRLEEQICDWNKWTRCSEFPNS